MTHSDVTGDGIPLDSRRNAAKDIFLNLEFSGAQKPGSLETRLTFPMPSYKRPGGLGGMKASFLPRGENETYRDALSIITDGRGITLTKCPPGLDNSIYTGFSIFDGLGNQSSQGSGSRRGDEWP